jgi:hypothetical protein
MLCVAAQPFHVQHDAHAGLKPSRTVGGCGTCTTCGVLSCVCMH